MYPPLEPARKYLIAIHSPNIIQKVSELDYFSFHEGGLYRGEYSQMITHFLINGFESNCDEYDIRNEYGTIRMENDCRVRCIAPILMRKHKDESIVPLQTLDLVRREHRSSFGNISISLFGDFDFEDEAYDICSEKCKPDCNTRLYFTQINKINDLSYLLKEDIYQILIKRSPIPEIIVRHSFEMTLISFVCNFGGLLGMWLGFSVLSISEHIFQTIKRFFSFDRNKIILFKINFKNKFIQKNFIKKSNASSQQNNLPMVEINL